ncbi:MAG: methyltransferase [Alphaproteobacteria bacterium]|nr:methyltransferase [Alphaproteobacteria bacterium]
MTLETAIDRLARVTARLNYLAPHSERPVRYNYPPPPGVPVQSGTFTAQPVEIVDARPIAERFSLDRQGFALIGHASAVGSFDDADIVRRRYFPEVEEVVRLATGAERVLAFDHNVRSATPAMPTGTVKEPVKRVHNDFTEASGPRRAAAELAAAGLDPGLIAGRRFALVNLWRPIRGPIQDSPLALCDARTIAADDFVIADLVYPDRVGEIHQFRHSPDHRWYYFSAMRADEALLIKCFDSATDGSARFTAHSAFDDPTTPANARPRESIEVRTLAIYGPAGG